MALEVLVVHLHLLLRLVVVVDLLALVELLAQLVVLAVAAVALGFLVALHQFLERLQAEAEPQVLAVLPAFLLWAVMGAQAYQPPVGWEIIQSAALVLQVAGVVALILFSYKWYMQP